MKEKIIETVVVYLVPLLLTGLVALVGFGIRALRKKFEADGKISLVEGAVLKVLNVGEMVVRDIEATTKRSLEEKAKDGLTPEEYRLLRDEAIAKLKASLGERGLAELKGAIGLAPEAVDTYLGGVVERAVTTVSTQSAAKEAAVKGAASDAPFVKLPGGLPPLP